MADHRQNWGMAKRANPTVDQPASSQDRTPRSWGAQAPPRGDRSVDSLSSRTETGYGDAGDPLPPLAIPEATATIEDQDPLNGPPPDPGPELGLVLAAKPKGARHSSVVRLGIVLVACLALAVPVVGALAAPTSSTAPTTPEAEGPGQSNSHGNGQDPGNGNGNGHKLDKGHGNPFKGGHGPGNGPITITSISGSNLSLTTEDGWTRTITITSASVITKGGQTIAAGDLKVGDVIRFAQTRNADGTYSIDAIRVATPRTGGEVTAITGDSITVKQKGGTTRVITVTGSTVYTVESTAGSNDGAETGSKADVGVGTEIEAEGTVTGDTFTATAIHVELPHLGGTVTGKTADTITITTEGGTTASGTAATIHLSRITTYRIKGNAAAKLADIAVGDRITAAGTLRADGSLDAVTVRTRNGHGNGNDKQGNSDGNDMDGGDAPAAPASAAPG